MTIISVLIWPWRNNTSFIATVFSLFYLRCCWSLSAVALWGHQTLLVQRTWSWCGRVCLFSLLFLLWPTDLHKPTPALGLILHRRAEAYLQPYCTHELNSGNIINQSHTVFARMFLQYVLVMVFWVIAVAFQCGFQVVFLLQDDSHTLMIASLTLNINNNNSGAWNTLTLITSGHFRVWKGHLLCVEFFCIFISYVK